MSLESIRQKLVEALAEVDALITPPVPFVSVGMGDNLESLIANGVAGTIYKLPTAYSCGSITISKPCTIMRDEILPDQRITASAQLPRVNGQIYASAPDISLIGLEVLGTVASNTLVMATSPNFTMNKVRLMGSPNGQKRGVYAAAPNINISQSHIGNCWYSSDSQAILTERDVDGLFVHDCFLEASGENFMAGGGDALASTRMPKNMTFTNCHFYKPEHWRSQASTGNKNLFELKMAQKVKVDNCIFENNWVDAQVGYGIVLSVRNQYGRDPYAVIEDVEFTNCTMKHVAAGISILGRDYLYSSDVMKRVKFKNFTLEDVSSVYGGNGRTLQLQGGPQDLVFEDFKVITSTPGNIHSAIEFSQPQHPFNGLVFRNVEFYEGWYGVQHTGDGFPTGVTPPLRGTQTLNYFNPNGYVWDGVKIHDGPNNWNYPVGTTIIPG